MQKGELISRFMASWKDKPYDNMIVCAAAALCGTFYYYDRQYPFSAELCVILTVIIYAVWIGCAFISGKERKLSFIIFSYAYWLIPFMYTLYYSARDNLRHYSKWLAMINRIMSGILKSPFYVASGRADSDPTIMAGILLMCVMAAYTLGYVLAYFYDKNFVKVHENAVKAEDELEYETDESEKSSNIIEFATLNELLFGNDEEESSGDDDKNNFDEEDQNGNQGTR